MTVEENGNPLNGDNVPLTLVKLLSELAGVELIERWCDGALMAVLLGLRGGRRLIAVERTYREGILILLDPTEQEVLAGRAGRLWDLWNSDRAELLAGAL